MQGTRDLTIALLLEEIRRDVVSILWEAIHICGWKISFDSF
jgi:hypothetical protein